ncbi:MAG: sodium-dependent bicarbonate transport family permease [Alphaproteobacteria bacterium]
MDVILNILTANLLSPIVLFFVLGLAAAIARSDLNIPEPFAKALSLYLMLAIGFKGGAEVARAGLDSALLLLILAGIALSFIIPAIAFSILRVASPLPRTDAAAVAAHYGSISIVTFIAASEFLQSQAIAFEGYLVAVAAAMEAPAILTGIWLAQRGRKANSDTQGRERRMPSMREILFNGSIVMLVGAFIIGWITGDEGLETMAPFVVDPFKGVLALFLLDMGLIAGRGLRSSLRMMGLRTILFGIYMPLISAVIATGVVMLLDLSTGSGALLITLAASASYIAVPAAMRIALPEAKPAIYATMSLGITFPFNLAIGIPLYAALAAAVT